MDGETLVALLIGVALTAAGGYAVYDHYEQQLESRTVEATVLSSDVDRSPQSTQAVIEYRYTVDGETHVSAQLCPVSGVICYDDAQAVVDRYPEGGTVTAYVDSTKRDDAYLLAPGLPWKLLFIPGLGLLVLSLVVGKALGVVEDVSS